MIPVRFGANERWGQGMFRKWIKRNQIPHCQQEENIFPDIRLITQWEGKTGDLFYTRGALVQVKNGKGLLYEYFSEEPDKAAYDTLMFGDRPLFQLQGDEYFCPTCEKIVRSGYQLEQTEEFHEERMNGENVPFVEALEGLKPLLGLLKDNCYVILDTQLYPVDGNGHIFWNVPASEEAVPGSCLFYRGDGEWGCSRPHFTVATQSIRKLRESRVEYYREHPSCRAVAYYMDGYMTALLDGHHKALAAALEHRSVNALVIMRCYPVTQYHGKGSNPTEYLQAGEMRFSCEQYGVKAVRTMAWEKAPLEKMQRLRGLFSEQEPPFPYDNESLACVYPNAREISDVDAYVNEYGEITEEWLDRIQAEEHICNPEEMRTLMGALAGLRHERLFELADYFLWNCSYLKLLAFHDTDTFGTIVEQLMKLPHTGELVDYMVDLMVEYEDEYPSVGERIKEWL